MSKRQLDWKDVGRVFAMFLELFKNIRDIFTTQGIGLEIIDWITGEGKDEFVKDFLRPLGERFLIVRRTIVVDENTIRVDLDAPLILPFDNAMTGTQITSGGGWVTVQRRTDGLYIDDHKICLYLSEYQKDGQYNIDALYSELAGKKTLHPNILDALRKHWRLIPEEWYDVSVLFLAVTYYDQGGGRCFRYLVFEDDEWYWDYLWFNNLVCDCNRTAIIED